LLLLLLFCKLFWKLFEKLSSKLYRNLLCKRLLRICSKNLYKKLLLLLLLLLRDMYDDMIRFEGKISATDLEWTIIRPSRLMDAPVRNSGGLWIGEGVLPKGYRHEVDRRDVAKLVVKLVKEGGSSGKMLGVSC
jgi:hypothetical protein